MKTKKIDTGFENWFNTRSIEVKFCNNDYIFYTEKRKSKVEIKQDMTKKINWDNAKSPQGIVVKYYISRFLKNLYDNYTQGQYKTFMARANGDAVTAILNACDTDPKIACEVIHKASVHYKNLNIPWTLSTVAKNCDDFRNQITRR